MSTHSRRERYAGVVRRVRPLVSWFASLAALIVILAVLRGAGVPLSLPGIAIVLLLLFVGRGVIGWRRRRRVTSRSRSR